MTEERLAVLRRGRTELAYEDEEGAIPFRDDDEALEAFVWLERLTQQFNRAKKGVQAALIGHITKSGRPLMLGDQAIKVGVSSTETCNDVAKAVDEALSLCGGDIDVFIELLAKNALKPGAAGTLFGPEYRKKHFTKKWKPALSATGARKEAQKYLQKVPKAFLPRKKDDGREPS